MQHYDVVVIGKGNAALCAALSASDAGATVAMLEAAPEEESGGNSRFAGGVMRFAYAGVDDLLRVTELTAEEIAGPILFLASDLSSGMTGEIVNVNCGSVLCG